MHGHELVFCLEPYRLSLRCLGCGYETPGWVLDPEVRYTPPSSSDQMLRPSSPTIDRPLGLLDIPRGAAIAQRSGPETLRDEQPVRSMRLVS